MKQWSFAQLSQLMKVSITSSMNCPVTGFAVDSRLVKQGNLFFALKGAHVDGHQFLSAAAVNGAVAAVVNESYNGPDFGLLLIKVPDPLIALQELAKSVLQQRKSKIVAVTGSLGKTTTKDFITTLLKSKYSVSCSPGNSNSQIGLPLTILNHTDGAEDVLVLEMGMTHSGQIKQLLQIAPPDIAVMTTVALVHAGNFNSLEDIARAKAEVLTHPKTTLGVIPHDVLLYDEIRNTGTCQKISFFDCQS